MNLFLHCIDISYNGKFSDQIIIIAIHYSFPDYMLQILLINKRYVKTLTINLEYSFHVINLNDFMHTSGSSFKMYLLRMVL